MIRIINFDTKGGCEGVSNRKSIFGVDILIFIMVKNRLIKPCTLDTKYYILTKNLLIRTSIYKN